MFGIFVKKLKSFVVKVIALNIILLLGLVLFGLIPVINEISWIEITVKFVWFLFGLIGIYACKCVFEQNI